MIEHIPDNKLDAKITINVLRQSKTGLTNVQPIDIKAICFQKRGKEPLTTAYVKDRGTYS